MSNAEGVQCSGTYDANIATSETQVEQQEGELSCSDGRNGTWSVVTIGITGGTGVGRIGEDSVKIKIGEGHNE